MNLIVADLVQKDGLAPLAAAQPGHEVVAALRHIGRDFPATERAAGNAPACFTMLFHVTGWSGSVSWCKG